MEELERYCKKLRLGQEILSDYESIEFTDKKDYLTKVLKQSFDNLEIRKKNRRIKEAKFDIVKTFENYDTQELELPESITLESLKNVEFIEKSENIIFYGPSGRGKTHLATAIGITAAQNRNSTYFINCNDLIANLKKANSENRFINRINHYAKYKVLVIDEVGFLPVDPEGANMLFQLINKRYERHSTIITTNKPFGKWHEIFNDVILANAILDRLLHHSHIININGNSYRLKNKIKIDSESTEPIQI